MNDDIPFGFVPQHEKELGDASRKLSKFSLLESLRNVFALPPIGAGTSRERLKINLQGLSIGRVHSFSLYEVLYLLALTSLPKFLVLAKTEQLLRLL